MTSCKMIHFDVKKKKYDALCDQVASSTCKSFMQTLDNGWDDAMIKTRRRVLVEES